MQIQKKIKIQNFFQDNKKSSKVSFLSIYENVRFSSQRVFFFVMCKTERKKKIRGCFLFNVYLKKWVKKNHSWEKILLKEIVLSCVIFFFFSYFHRWKKIIHTFITHWWWRCQPAHQEQFGVRYLAQGHFDRLSGNHAQVLWTTKKN